MTVAIYNKEIFFETLQKFHTKFKDTPVIQDVDNIYSFNIVKESVEYGKKFSVTLSQDNSELFTFNMTVYDEEEFKSKIKGPAMWDSELREGVKSGQFNTFLVEKNLYNKYEISMTHNGQILRDEDLDGENDEDKIDDLLFSVDFYELVHSTYYLQNNVNQKKLKM